MTREIPVRNPRTGENDYRIQAPDEAELAKIAAGLRAAQPAWQELGAESRGQILTAWAQALLAEPRHRCWMRLATDTGRYLIATSELYALPAAVARWSESGAQSCWMRVVSGIPSRPGVGVRDNWVPLQLVGVISPWNFPLLLSMIDAIPALAAGCARCW